MFRKFAATILSIFCVIPVPLWRERIQKIQEPMEEMIGTNIERQEMDMLELIDEFSKNVADFYNREWREEIVGACGSEESLQEGSLLFAATINTIARDHNSNYRSKPINTEESMKENLKAKREMWADLTGERFGRGYDSDGNPTTEDAKISNRWKQEKDGTISSRFNSEEDLLASLPEQMSIPRNANSSGQSTASDRLSLLD